MHEREKYYEKLDFVWVLFQTNFISYFAHRTSAFRWKCLSVFPSSYLSLSLSLHLSLFFFLFMILSLSLLFAITCILYSLCFDLFLVSYSFFILPLFLFPFVFCLSPRSTHSHVCISIRLLLPAKHNASLHSTDAPITACPLKFNPKHKLQNTFVLDWMRSASRCSKE